MASSHPNTHYVDLRNTLPNHAQWHNELHPSKDGFKLVTDKIVKTIQSVV